MNKETKLKLIEYLSQFITDSRKEKIKKVLSERTRYLTVCLEDIYQPQNASAVLRTAECLGIQNIHIIENRNKYNINPDVTIGADKWLNLYYYNLKQFNEPTKECINKLRMAGYTIVATTPHINNTSPEEIQIDKPLALFFGNEPDGLSNTMLENADIYLKIPMVGFSESFNISVSAAIILYTIRKRIEETTIQCKLTEDECIDLTLEWYRRSINKCENIEKTFFKNYNL